MSGRNPRQKRRPRVVSAEVCPRCGAAIGKPCKTYKGRGGPPHAIPVEPIPDAGPLPQAGRKAFYQATLWPGITSEGDGSAR